MEKTERRDLVKKFFAEMRKKGYFAKLRLADCQSCSWAIVPEDKQDKVIFSTFQDEEDWKRAGYMYIAWAGDGAEIVRTAWKVGLVAQWDGQENTRIKLS